MTINLPSYIFRVHTVMPGFPAGVENMEGGFASPIGEGFSKFHWVGGFSQYMSGAWGVGVYNAVEKYL